MNAASPAVNSPAADAIVRFCASDPLFILLYRICRGSVFRVAVLAFFMHALCMVGIGFALSCLRESAGTEVLPVYHPGDLVMNLFCSLLLIPSIWTFYAWQPRGIISTFRELASNSVLADCPPKDGLEAFLESSVTRPAARRINLAIATVFMVISALVFFPCASSPDNPLLYGARWFWWRYTPLYFWALWLPLTLANLYMITWIIVRQVVAVRGLGLLFKSFRITPSFFHPDRCNGFACLGVYGVRSATLALLLGIFVALVITLPKFFGSQINLAIDTVLESVVYAIAVPFLFVLPLWSAHLALSESKAAMLESVAAQIRPLLSECAPDRIETSVSLVEALHKKYQLIDAEHCTWPVRLGTAKGLTVTALIPPLYTGIGLLVNWYFKSK